MNEQAQPQRLDRISTSWTLLAQAHQGTADAASAARRLLLERYGGAVRRFLGALLRDDEAADDLTQEFGLALIEGKLATATPDRGRFRDYVKATAVHLVHRYRQKQKRRPQLTPAGPQPAVLSASETDLSFVQSWRDELLARTWEALAQAHPTYFTVLHFRAAHPDLAAEQLAGALGPQLGKKMTVEGVRQALCRARALFADLLIAELTQSLKEPTPEEIEQELGELNLLGYCRPALERKEKRPREKK
jgi:DNA-directed RNA polymerase specialized sigma24 family protein